MEIEAYRVADSTELPIIPAPEKREWHKDIPGIGACLPLTIGNGAGWWLLNPATFEVARPEVYNHQVIIRWWDIPEQPHVASHFGFGIMTVLIPYVFRTPPGWELLIRGPSNVFYEGLQPFEGIVETDWHMATATMNWMVERDKKVVVRRGDPLAQIVPVKTEALEQFTPVVKDMPEDMESEFLEFAQRRMERLEKNVEEGKTKYQANYPRDERTRRRHLRMKPL